MHNKGPNSGYTGIGLSLVKELVNRYGGRIVVTDRVSGAPEEGAMFRISLPRVLT